MTSTTMSADPTATAAPEQSADSVFDTCGPSVTTTAPAPQLAAFTMHSMQPWYATAGPPGPMAGGMMHMGPSPFNVLTHVAPTLDACPPFTFPTSMAHMYMPSVAPTASFAQMSAAFGQSSSHALLAHAAASPHALNASFTPAALAVTPSTHYAVPGKRSREEEGAVTSYDSVTQGEHNSAHNETVAAAVVLPPPVMRSRFKATSSSLNAWQTSSHAVAGPLSTVLPPSLVPPHVVTDSSNLDAWRDGTQASDGSRPSSGTPHNVFPESATVPPPPPVHNERKRAHLYVSSNAYDAAAAAAGMSDSGGSMTTVSLSVDTAHSMGQDALVFDPSATLATASARGFGGGGSSGPDTETFQCRFQGCLARFSRGHARTIHERSHTDTRRSDGSGIDKPHACTHPGCFARFRHATERNRHVMVHTGDKPFACVHPGCGARFFTSWHLTEHTRRHTGAKPFKCRHLGCSETFAKSAHRTRHECTHTGTLPYPCRHEGCPAAFDRADTRLRHERDPRYHDHRPGEVA